MKIAFVHQNFPGQFKRLAATFAREGHEVVALGMVKESKFSGIKYYSYNAVPGPEDEPYQNRYSPVVPRLRRAYGVAHRARQLAEQGFHPDVVVVNTGWGENLFLKDVWPDARHVAYFEYYYAAKGQDLDFDPEYSTHNVETIWKLRIKNAMQLGAFDAADLAVAPTTYQRDTFPAYLRDRIAVIHDGIDTANLKPDPSAFIRIGKDGPRLQRFYSDVFGWELDTNNPGGCGMLRQGELSAGIGPAQGGGDGHVTFYVDTADAAETLRKVEAAGGRIIMPPTEVAPQTTVALFADPEGHLVGLM